MGNASGKKRIRIMKLRVQHIKCFDDLSVQFNNNTNLIIGTNGRGKSTILQVIALGLSGIPFVRYPYCWKEVVKKGKSRGLFEIDLIYDGQPAHLEFSVDAEDNISCTKGGQLLESIKKTSLILAYGANRSIKLEDPRPDSIEPIATLFGENGYLKHIKVSSTYKLVSDHFATLQRFINKVLETANGSEPVEMVDYDSDTFYFRTPSNPESRIPVEALSEGFKSTFVWLLDAIIRIVERGGNLENAFDINGIILLDEIDLHLHPSWQRTILHSIEMLFPNIQFIATTHSPFVVQSANPQHVVVLDLDSANSVKVVDKNITSALSYNALVREVFNISSPFNHEIEEKIACFKKMAAEIRNGNKVDKKALKTVVDDIANRGVELDGMIRRELLRLEKRIGKTLDIWKE